MKRKRSVEKTEKNKKEKKEESVPSLSALSLVFQYMDFESVFNATLVCKNWRKVGWRSIKNFSIFEVKEGMLRSSEQIHKMVDFLHKNTFNLKRFLLNNSKISDNSIKNVNISPFYSNNNAIQMHHVF